MSDIVELTKIHQPNDNISTFSEDASSLLNHSVNEGMFDWDLRSNKIVFSVKWKNMLGYHSSEIPNHLDVWKSIVHPEDVKKARTNIENFVANDSEILETEIRLKHKSGQYLHIRGVIFKVKNIIKTSCERLIGYHINCTQRKRDELYTAQSRKILEMIARGDKAVAVYDEIAHLYESRYPGMRCSMLELEGNTLIHGGAPSMPKAYIDAINGFKNGPEIGSCGASTYTGKRVLVEDIETDPKWKNIKQYALPHGLRCCWSEPVISSTGKVLGAFSMYYDHSALPNEKESEDLIAAAMLTSIVMERDHNQKSLRNMAYTDELTGIHNRRYGQCLIRKLIKKSLLTQDKFAIFHLDLDNFKSINDNFGHDVGDAHLIEITKRLAKKSNNQHSIFRLGGDEFCVIIPEFENKIEIEQLAKEYLDAISEPILVCNRKFNQSASLGISLFPQDSQEQKGLGKLADTALFFAKKKVKNSFVFYHPEQTKAIEYNFKLEHLLKEAIANKELTLAYQAKSNFSTNKIAGLEVLCRWCHPELGHVSPIEFIGIAERTGMIAPLTEQIMETAFNQFVSWKSQGLNFGSIAINISPSLFIEPDFIHMIKRNIDKTGMNPKDIELEITESFSQTEQESIKAIEKLKSIGLNIAIDDFGQGYSCFASLSQMDIDILKIDKLFIDALATDSKAELLVKSMIEMAHALGFKVVAEGIESLEQLKLLKALGCDLAQGYFLNRPTAPEQLPNTLHQSGLI